MRIGIITFHRSVSYGAFLQTYALSRYLMGLGHDVKVIDYNPTHRDAKICHRDKRLLGLHPQNFVNAHREKCFADYIERYLPLTERSYRTLEELRDDPPAMDAYICGSDQIWNPEHTGGEFDAGYFGGFGPAHIRRVAYAPSIGSAHLSAEHHSALRNHVSGLDHLSAREKSACDLVSGITERPCAHVVDPTMLISDYTELLPTTKRPISEPYVLVFSLAHSRLLNDVIQVAKSALGIPVLYVASSYRVWKYDWRFRFSSPGDWLGLFLHASAVVTDSFHGTVFALKLHKPFVSISLGERIRDRNERMTDLLGWAGLSDRFIADPSAVENARLIAVDPDWSTATQRLSAMVSQSAQFLANALTADDGSTRTGLQ